MYYVCCVCNSSRQDATLHHFPCTEKRLDKWLECLNRDDLKKLSSEQLSKLFVCQKHFEKKFITSKFRLLSRAYPTLITEEEIASGIPSQDDSTENVDPQIEHSYSRKRHYDHTYPRLESSREKRATDHTYSRKRHHDHTYATTNKRPLEVFQRVNESDTVKDLTANDSVAPIEASDKNIGACTESLFEASDKNIGAGTESLIEASDKNIGACTDSLIEASDKNIGAGTESPSSCSLEVDQDESDEEQSDEDGCNPAISSWIKKLQGRGTARVATEALIESSDNNVKTEGSISCLRSSEQRIHNKSDESTTYPALAREGFLKADDQGSAEQMDDYTTDNWGETEMCTTDSWGETEICTTENWEETKMCATDNWGETEICTTENWEETKMCATDNWGETEICTMDDWGETEMECVEREEMSVRCCACLCSGSQLMPLESIEIVVRPGLTRHLDTLYTDLTGLTVPECVGGAVICKKCLSQLTVAYMFKLRCVESHAVLSSVLPPPAHHRQQSAPGSPEGWPPSQDESVTHKEEVCLPKKEACPTLPVATASPDVKEPSGTVNTLSSTSHSSTETKATSSDISITKRNKKRKKAEELNVGSSKRNFKLLKYEESEIVLQKCRSCGKAAAEDAKIELAIQLTKQSLCCICTKSFRGSTALREHARTSHSTGFQDFLITATNTSRMCTCDYNKKLLITSISKRG